MSGQMVDQETFSCESENRLKNIKTQVRVQILNQEENIDRYNVRKGTFLEVQLFFTLMYFQPYTNKKTRMTISIKAKLGNGSTNEQ